MRQIYLTGFMGCGKSTVSYALAKRLNRRQVEMDESLERQAGKPVAKIFEEDGEEAFRRMESELIRRLAEGPPAVVSCGGGAVLRQENVAVMRSSGLIVLLTASPHTIYDRVKGSAHRPLLNGRMNPQAIAKLMEERRPFYEAAAMLTVETDAKTVEEIVTEIAAKIACEDSGQGERQNFTCGHI